MQTATYRRAIPRPVMPQSPRGFEAFFQGSHYSAFRDSVGGVILARPGDGWSTYFTAGGEAAAFMRGVARCDTGAAFDNMAAEYDGLMDPPSVMRGQPDESGLFWLWTGRAAA